MRLVASDTAQRDKYVRNQIANSFPQTPEWLKSMASKVWSAYSVRESEKSKRHEKKAHRALKELEKWFSGAGLTMLHIFFSTSPEYDDKNVRDNVSKKFRKRASQTKRIRRAEQARRWVTREQARRAQEKSPSGQNHV